MLEIYLQTSTPDFEVLFLLHLFIPIFNRYTREYIAAERC